MSHIFTLFSSISNRIPGLDTCAVIGYNKCSDGNGEQVMVLWIFLGVVALALLFFCVMAVGAAVVFCRFFGRRYNGNRFVKYFTAEDFAGLEAEPIAFPSDAGQLLRGYLYKSSPAREQRALIIFSHGFGAGHLAYTTEIHALAKAGFLVLAYDGTGCGESGGDSLRGFDQGPIDLDFALRFAAKDPRLKDLPKILVGHSWGAFTTLNALAFHPEVCGAVGLCGFVSGAGVMAQTVFHRVQPCKAVFAFCLRVLNRIRFGKRANQNTIRALLRTERPVLLCYGLQDRVVPYYGNGKKVLQKCRERKNIRQILFEDKGHNVYLSNEAESYMNTTFRSIAKQVKKDPSRAEVLYKRVDYYKMTEEDESVMRSIIDFCGEIADLLPDTAAKG